jgi:deoxyhypusine synthase
MGSTAFTARQIAGAADVLEAMARNKDCFVVMTLSRVFARRENGPDILRSC